ncbi:MAG: hypothetical protein HY298_20765 [Verrucomicrobia bacterium]|nr:hypothetical protein [Verrucomicrobiota bacterium]
MLEKPRNRFEVDIERHTLKLRSDLSAAEGWANKEILIQFDTSYPEFHLGLIALVARESKRQSSLHHSVPFAAIRKEVEILNRCPCLKNRTKLVSQSPSAALYRYFRNGIDLENDDLKILLENVRQGLDTIPASLRSSLKDIVRSQGAPPERVRYDMRGLLALGLKPTDIAERSFEKLEQFLVDLEHRSRGFSCAEVLKPPERMLLDTCHTLGISGVSEAGLSRAELRFGTAKEIRILAFTALGLIRSSQQVLATAVSAGATIRVILADPKSRIFESSARMTFRESYPRSPSNAIKETESRLKQIVPRSGARSSSGRSGCIYLGHFDSEFRCFLTICDDSWGWLTLHLPPKDSIATPSFELVHGKLLNDCISYFDNLWKLLEKRKKIRKLKG